LRFCDAAKIADGNAGGNESDASPDRLGGTGLADILQTQDFRAEAGLPVSV
jgi:hypothetical protein